MTQYADQRAHDVAWMTAAECSALDARRALCEASVTLDGRPAKISGTMHDFAMVRDMRSGLGCEWAWETVARIVANGGNFRT